MQFAKYIPVVLASMLKFFGGPLTGAALGLTWPETATCTVIGMMTSVVLVLFAGALLRQIARRFNKKPARMFSTRTRQAVRIWQRTGLAGIAFLTPLILSPIGGAALAVSFRVSRPRILLYMLVSGIGWAVVQTLLLYQTPGLRGLFK
jgi:hypothetical protein